VGGMILPSGIFIGPFMVPVNFATEQVQSSCPNKTLYGSFAMWLSGKVLKNSIDSASCAVRPRVGSGLPGQKTAVLSAWRFLNVSQSWEFQASSNVFINSLFLSTLFITSLPSLFLKCLADQHFILISSFFLRSRTE